VYGILSVICFIPLVVEIVKEQTAFEDQFPPIHNQMLSTVLTSTNGGVA